MNISNLWDLYVYVYTCIIHMYVLCIAEDNNTRVLFEKVLATMPADKTK